MMNEKKEMLLIKEIYIRNFRSIINTTIKVKKMNIFVGLNDAGKSNVLKALNLFFNNETELGMPFDFKNDYSKFAPIRKKKPEEITIRITFAVPSGYKDNKDIVWEKVWRKNGLFIDNKEQWDLSPYSRIPMLFSRIQYKYVPAVKSQDYFKYLLSILYDSIAQKVDSELAQKASEYSDTLSQFTKRIGEIVKQHIGIDSGLNMPSNQADIFKQLIFVTKDISGKEVNLNYRGDGIKAMHIPAILKYISEQDKENLGARAIPVTTIWGYEEPENGVELMRCFDLSEELTGFCDDVQQFITSHSPAFYQMESETYIKKFFVYKDDNNHGSIFDNEIDINILHKRIGLMPLIAPFVEEKQREIEEKSKQLMLLKQSIDNAGFVDMDTIFVEGKTDRLYLQRAIAALSPKLQYLIESEQLRIVTREDEGCGVTLLKDWAVAWIHFGYKSKAIFLLDNDKAGIKAKDDIRTARIMYEKKNYKLKELTLHPTEDIKKVNSNIRNTLFYSIEHLFSYDFWNELKSRGWVMERDTEEKLCIYRNCINSSESIDSMIDRVIDCKEIRETIVKYKAHDNHKTQICSYADEYYKNGHSLMYEGLRNTIEELEKEFCG